VTGDQHPPERDAAEVVTESAEDAAAAVVPEDFIGEAMLAYPGGGDKQPLRYLFIEVVSRLRPGGHLAVDRGLNTRAVQFLLADQE
jgi:hypothetical protein